MGNDPLIGAILLGRYRVDRRIGAGAMGRVYAGEHLRLGRPVAIKVLSQHLADDPEYRHRFLRESSVVASLHHPSIVRVHDADEAPEALFLVMQLVDGSDLRSVIREHGRLDAESALDLIDQVAGALDAAHAAGLVHRDVKPANVLVEGRHAYLADFGLARPIADGHVLTQTARFVGTLAYAAPEQFEGGLVDARSDIYSLGCLLYELLCGVPPFQGSTDFALMRAHLFDPPPLISRTRPDLRREIDDVVLAALSKSPEARPASAGALAEHARRALEEHAEGLRAVPRASRRNGARRAVAWSIPVACGLLAFVIGSATLDAGTRTIVHRAAARTVRQTAAARDVRLTPASLHVPDTYRDAPPSRALGGPAINLRDHAGSRLVLLTTHVTGRTLLPAGLARAGGGRAVVSLGVPPSAIRGYRYTGLEFESTPAVAYVVPTDAGVVTAVCAGATPASRTRCRTVLRTLRIARVRVFAPGDPFSQTRVRATLAKLSTAVVRARRALGAAREPGAQSLAAATLARAFATAAKALPSQRVSPELSPRVETLRAALQQISRSLDTLSVASRGQRADQFARASGVVKAAQQTVARSLDAFTAGS